MSRRSMTASTTLTMWFSGTSSSNDGGRSRFCFLLSDFIAKFAMSCYDYQWFIRNTNILKIYDMTKAFALSFSMKALFFSLL